MVFGTFLSIASARFFPRVGHGVGQPQLQVKHVAHLRERES